MPYFLPLLDYKVVVLCSVFVGRNDISIFPVSEGEGRIIILKDLCKQLLHLFNVNINIPRRLPALSPFRINLSPLC